MKVNSNSIHIVKHFNLENSFVFKSPILFGFICEFYVLEESKRDRSVNSDTDTPLAKKRRVLESDEEEEDPESAKIQKIKQTRIIVSDDED